MTILLLGSLERNWGDESLKFSVIDIDLCTSQEIHGLLRQGVSADNISAQLSPWASALFDFLPPFIRKQVYLNYFYFVINCQSV